MKTITLTPSGFDQKNPKRQENINRCNKAMENQRNAITAQANLFNEILKPFGGIEGICQAFEEKWGLEMSPRELKAQTKEWAGRYEQLDRQRSEAEEELLRSMGGHPPRG